MMVVLRTTLQLKFSDSKEKLAQHVRKASRGTCGTHIDSARMRTYNMCFSDVQMQGGRKQCLTET